MAARPQNNPKNLSNKLQSIKQETPAAKDDAPSVRISLQLIITVCAFPERCLCLYPHAGSKGGDAAMAQDEADGLGRWPRRPLGAHLTTVNHNCLCIP